MNLTPIYIIAGGMILVGIIAIAWYLFNKKKYDL